jgi:hypothetical protein
MEAEWSSVKIPMRTKRMLKQISKNTHKPMYRIIADGLEGQMAIKFMRLAEIEEKLIGISDLVTVLWKKTDQLDLTATEVYNLIDKMSNTLADELELYKVGGAMEPGAIRKKLKEMSHLREGE